MICVAAANAGATSQDLKTGYIVGGTPRYQQLALFIGAIVSSVFIGFTVRYLDTPTPDLAARGIEHAIGEKFAAPQATLMATLIKGLLSFNLDWQFVLVGVILAITVELCGVKSLSFAVGAYLPLSTTLPIFGGGVLKAVVDWRTGRHKNPAEEELSKGNLFATGLVAGGALAGVVVALLSVNENVFHSLAKVNAEHGISKALGSGGYQLLGLAFFLLMAYTLYRIAIKKDKRLG
jgi:putative OPT family oligopeptide transporter